MFDVIRLWLRSLRSGEMESPLLDRIDFLC